MGKKRLVGCEADVSGPIVKGLYRNQTVNGVFKVNEMIDQRRNVRAHLGYYDLQQKICIWSSLFLAQSSQHAWNFLSEQSNKGVF